MLGKKLKCMALLFSAGISFAAYGITLQNKWNRDFFLISVTKTGEAKLERVDSNKTVDLPYNLNNTSVIGIAAWDIRRHGKGITGNYYNCSTDAFMTDKIEGNKLNMNKAVIDHKEGKDAAGNRTDNFTITYP